LDAGYHDIGTGPQRGGEYAIDLVVKEAITDMIRDDDGDQHDDLLVIVRPELIDEGHEGLHDGRVVGMKDPK
jgi:hypothetical protein